MRKIYVKSGKEVLVSKYISATFKNVPYSAICKAIRNKDIRVNNTKISQDVKVKNNDVLDIYISDYILFNIPKAIQYYYSDDNIVIAFKPQGILSNNAYSDEPNFEQLVKKDLEDNNIQICHRLDRNTVGLIIFSKNATIHKEILDEFKNIKKEYIAYVSNSKFNKLSDTLNGYILTDKKTGFSKIYNSPVESSELVSTTYTLLEQNFDIDYAKLNVTISAGKTHQIRAHLSSINHPIIGDSKYGQNEINRKFKKNKQLLIAYRYTFNFSENSILSYLNDKSIQVEDEVINKLFNI